MLRVRYPFALLLAIFAAGCASPSRETCDGRLRVAKGADAIDWTENEEKLMCGDHDVPGWKDVPLSQTEFHAERFLGDRAYFNPKFRLVGGTLEVDPGARRRIGSIRYEGAPPEFFEEKFVGWAKEGVTPHALDDIQNWSLRRMKNIGYACAKVEVKANADTGVVDVLVIPGFPSLFPLPTVAGDSPLPRETLSRFHAFREGDPFDQDLLDLTSNRIQSSAVASHSIFLSNCADGRLLGVQHQIRAGESRLVRIGAGISTEEWLLARLNWSSTRLGRNASILSADLYASKVRQEASTQFEWHPWFNSPRWYLLPLGKVRHENEQNQEFVEYSVETSLGSSIEFRKLTLEGRAGPQLSFENRIRGPDVGWNRFLSLGTRWNLTNHDFQVYAGYPKTGFTLGLQTRSILGALNGDAWSHVVGLTGTTLFNLRRVDPAWAIFGVRFGVKTVLTSLEKIQSGGLPADAYSWLGGEDDVRGFSRKEVPDDDQGAISAAFTGFELRMPFLLPRSFDPFLFTDLGWLGDENFHFDSATYISPGFGLRWQSPFGSVRATLAHGYVPRRVLDENPEIEHLQFFLTLGREF